MKKQKAFTLIELMVTVAIVGILASIAYPSYQDSVRKSRREDAKGVLLGLANAMERRFTEANSYTGVTPTSTSYYTISITADANSYTLSAVPVSTDTCGTLTLTHTGVKMPSTAGCW
jgi:type IV pilus assembly protein PilE